MKALLCTQHFLHYKSTGRIFDTQVLVTPKRIVRSGPQLTLPQSNSSEILCLSSLSASLKKIQSKLKAPSCPQHFFWCSRAGNSKVNGRIQPKFEHVRDLCLSWLPASLMKIRTKVKVIAWRHGFSHYMSMEAFCCHDNHSFDGICSKT